MRRLLGFGARDELGGALNVGLAGGSGCGLGWCVE